MRLIDADALLENYDLKNAVKYGNKSAEQQDKSYSTLMRYEIADMIDDAPTIESPRPDWTPCAEGLPTEDGTYDVTLKSPFGRCYIEQNARFENGEWLTESDTGTVLAWMHPIDPYNPDHIREAGKVDKA